MKCDLALEKKQAKKRKKVAKTLSPMWIQQPNAKKEEHVSGGPGYAFMTKYGLDEHSHPMNWQTSIMPLTPENNLKDAVIANITDNKEKNLPS